MEGTIVSFEENTTSTYQALFKDSLGVAVGVSSFLTFVVTLTEKESGDIINSRTAVDLRVGGAWSDVDGMQAVIDADGNILLHLSADDNAIVTTPAPFRGEQHIIKIEMTALGSDARVLSRTRQYSYYVEKTDN